MSKTAPGVTLENAGKAHRVFLSYSRENSFDIAKRIRAELIRHNVVAWLDVFDLPSGNSFLDEIDRAISASDYFIFIESDKAIESVYCRDEWAKAIQLAKPIIPALTTGNFDNLPKEGNIYLHDSPNFSKQENFASALRKLLGHISNPPRPAGTPVGVPNLPRDYLRREPLVAQIVRALTSHKAEVLDRAKVCVGVAGMGGIGKSVLAATAATDYVVRRAFPDGIAWTAAGPDMAPSEVWASLAKRLGHNEERRLDVYEASALFEALTRNSEQLLVIDDVWEFDTLKPLLSVGKKCRVLATSRHVDLLERAECDIIPVDALSSQDSTRLFSISAGVSEDALSPIAGLICEACEYLPLAITLTASLLRGQSEHFYESILLALKTTDLSELPIRSPNYRYSTLFAAIHVSIGNLDQAQRSLLNRLSIFSNRKSIPQQPILIWLKANSPVVVHQQLKLLVQRNVLQQIGLETYSIHDLIFSYVRHTLTGDEKVLHGDFLKSYGNGLTEWCEFRNDQYLLHNLIHHIWQSGDHDGAIRTAAENTVWLDHTFDCTNGFQAYLNAIDFLRKQVLRTQRFEVALGGVCLLEACGTLARYRAHSATHEGIKFRAAKGHSRHARYYPS
jgi:hypothetical protein